MHVTIIDILPQCETCALATDELAGGLCADCIAVKLDSMSLRQQLADCLDFLSSLQEASNGIWLAEAQDMICEVR